MAEKMVVCYLFCNVAALPDSILRYFFLIEALVKEKIIRSTAWELLRRMQFWLNNWSILRLLSKFS